MKNKKLNQEKLKELIFYDPITGIFTWRKSRVGCKEGHIAGNKANTGYMRIMIKRRHYLSHRLAWFYMEGYLPEGFEVDHKNKVRDDNRWRNLRIVSRQCNSRNCRLSSRNTSGVTGVTWDSERCKWSSSTMVSGVIKNSGRFENLSDAVMARWEIEKKYNFPNCQTSSTSYLYLKNKRLI